MKTGRPSHRAKILGGMLLGTVSAETNSRYMPGTKVSSEQILQECLFFFSLLIYGTIDRKKESIKPQYKLGKKDRRRRKKLKERIESTSDLKLIRDYAAAFLSDIWHSYKPDQPVKDSEFLGLLNRIESHLLMDIIDRMSLDGPSFVCFLYATFNNIRLRTGINPKVKGLLDRVEPIMNDRLFRLDDFSCHTKRSSVKRGRYTIPMVLLCAVAWQVYNLTDSLFLGLALLFGGLCSSGLLVRLHAANLKADIFSSKELRINVSSTSPKASSQSDFALLERAFEENSSSEELGSDPKDEGVSFDHSSEGAASMPSGRDQIEKQVSAESGREHAVAEVKQKQRSKRVYESGHIQKPIKLSLEFPVQCLKELKDYYKGLLVFQMISRSGYLMPNLYAIWKVKGEHPLEEVFRQGKGQLVAPRGQSGIKRYSKNQYWVKGSTKQRVYAGAVHKVTTKFAGVATVFVFCKPGRKRNASYREMPRELTVSLSHN